MLRNLLLPLLAAALLCTACTEDQLLTGVEAEAAYVDLLSNLERSDTVAARSAAARLNERLRNLRALAYRPLGDVAAEERSFRLNRAECTFLEAFAFVGAGDLDQASVQLDRAVYELRAADPPVTDELYVIQVYDFLMAWLELVHQPDALETERVALLIGALREWKQVSHLRPDAFLYPELSRHPQAFLASHAVLDGHLGELSDHLDRGEMPDRQLMERTTEAVWGVIGHFGTEGAGKDELPPEEDKALSTPISL
ncbi:hypothetical protein [Lewinella sp. IMCC34191]|uniref:hypothetical protein n=1 Tax=Lewinella sp. IMCC34191 TaxID=2259172 RepID=UPI000E2220EC|nr:hypothetical protein [Lewinella sp. IMCC34191]